METTYWCYRIKYLETGGKITETRCISDKPQDVADVILNLIKKGEIAKGAPAHLTIAAEDLFAEEDAWVRDFPDEETEES